MLLNIEEESAEDARRILTLLCTAKRPLTVKELIDGIAVELGDDLKFNKDSILFNEDDIRRICPGFIESDFNSYDDEITIRIAHYSVQEYLESERIRQSKAARFSIKPEEANTEVASICLVYLVNPDFVTAWNSNRDDFGSKYPLAMYAATNWPAHYHEGSPTNPLLHDLALKFARSYSDAWATWVDIYKWNGYTRDGLGSRILTPLYVASRLSLDPIVGELAKEAATPPISSRRRREYYGTALVAAADQGHATTIHILLDHGADINYEGFDGTALHAASGKGHIKAMETLLNRGADIEAHDYAGRTPLYSAISSENEDAVRLLLDRGAKLDSPSAYETPLEAAASAGHLGVVTLLLDSGADINHARYQTPLEASRWHREVRLLLFSRGAVPEAGKSLEAAATLGDAQAVQRLLDEGADLNNGFPWTPLELAVSWGHIEVAKLLLDKGADLYKAGGTGRLLNSAAVSGHKQAVKLLLGLNGADVNEGRPRTPLEAAVYGGQKEVVQLLLDSGANIHHGLLLTPLETAVTRGNMDLVRLLVDRGADASLIIRMMPLAPATKHLEPALLQLLADKGIYGGKEETMMLGARVEMSKAWETVVVQLVR